MENAQKNSALMVVSLFEESRQAMLGEEVMAGGEAEVVVGAVLVEKVVEGVAVGVVTGATLERMEETEEGRSEEETREVGEVEREVVGPAGAEGPKAPETTPLMAESRFGTKAPRNPSCLGWRSPGMSPFAVPRTALPRVDSVRWVVAPTRSITAEMGRMLGLVGTPEGVALEVRAVVMRLAARDFV